MSFENPSVAGVPNEELRENSTGLERQKNEIIATKVKNVSEAAGEFFTISARLNQMSGRASASDAQIPQEKQFIVDAYEEGIRRLQLPLWYTLDHHGIEGFHDKFQKLKNALLKGKEKN
jgi:hypothetical protein